MLHEVKCYMKPRTIQRLKKNNLQLISIFLTVHALLCCHKNNKTNNVYLPTATIIIGEFLQRKWFVNLSCCWSHGSIAQWHLLQTVMADVSERHGFGEPVWSGSKSTIYFIQQSIRQSQPRLGSNPKKNFLKMWQEGTWVNQKQLMLSLSLKTKVQWWACFIYFLITFLQIPDESASHLLASVKQFSIGKQRSLHHCTIPTWTEVPETTLHRK